MVQNGSLAQSRLDDMAMRIVTAYYRFAQFEPGTGIPLSLTAPHEFVNARDPASDSIILQGAIEGHVLVKNVNNALPLSKPKVLSLLDMMALLRRKMTPTEVSSANTA